MSIISQLTKSLPKHIQSYLVALKILGHFECDGLSVYKQEPLAVVLPSEYRSN